MDRNTIIGFVLMGVVLFGYVFFSRPTAEQIAQARMQDSIAQVEAQKELELQQEQLKLRMAVAAQDSLDEAIDTTSLFAASKRGKAQKFTLQNELVKIDINTLGGTVTSAQLKQFKDQQKENVKLFDELNSHLNFTLALKEENIRTGELFFTPENITDSTITMRLKGRGESSIVFDYKLIPYTYMVNFTVNVEGMDKYILPNNHVLGIEWNDSLKSQEKGYTFENQYSTLTYKRKDNGTKKLSERKNDEKTPEETLDWVAFKNQFFSYVLIGYEGLSNADLKSTLLTQQSGYLKYMDAKMQTTIDATGKNPTRMQFYMGPNKFRLLQQMDKYSLEEGKDLKLDRMVYLGWPIVRYINRYFTIYVFDWLTKLGLSMGIVLLLITLLLRVIVYPTTKKSYMSSAKMRVLKPKLDEISAQYPNPEDNLKKQQEMMATYSKYGVSPMGGCLPVLIQMPIWIAMFNFVPNAIELRQQSFLWADDLSTYDDIIHWSNNLPLIGNHLSLFCILFCVTNLLYSWINMKMQKNMMVGQQADQMKMMQWMMMLMPLFFFFMFNDYSSGLNYYYFISLLAGAVSMWWLRWRTDDEKLLAKLEENYKKNMNNPQKMKGLAARLEALQKQQELQKKRYTK